MTYLDLILLVKIGGSAVFLVLPFLFLPAGRLMPLLQIEGSEAAMPMMRLYGLAVLALLVGYSFGLSWVSGGNFPVGVVVMGLVSNGGGAIFLLASGGYRKAAAMTAYLIAIAVSLAFGIANPAMVMQPL